MRIHFTHHWRRYDGMLVISILAFTFGFDRIGITILNFALEIER